MQEETLNELINMIARERGLNEFIVKSTLEAIILNFAKIQYGDLELNCKIHERGNIEIYAELKVIPNEEIKNEYEDEENFENSENDLLKIKLEDAQKRKPNIQIGETIREVLPFNISAVDIKIIAQELKRNLNKIQKEKEYDIFSSKIGEIAQVYVKRIDISEAILSFTDNLNGFGSEGEGILKKSKMLPNDIIKPNTYIKVYIEDVKKGLDKQIILSRTHPNFLKELLKAEIPEINDGLIEIKAISRDPGSLSKVALHTNRPTINPIKICIGDHGLRVRPLVEELSGEKINFIIWDENINQFIANALTPAKVLKVIEKQNNKFEAVVSKEDFSKAMGRGAQNVSLARKLCQVNGITLLTEEEEREKSITQMQKATQSLISNLFIEEMMAHVLISEGFDSTEIIAKSEIEDIININGFDEDLALILINRAKDYLEQSKTNLKKELEEKQADTSLFEITILTTEQIKDLLAKDILSKSDLAMLDAQELMDLFESCERPIDFDKACELISAARGITKKINFNTEKN